MSRIKLTTVDKSAIINIIRRSIPDEMFSKCDEYVNLPSTDFYQIEATEDIVINDKCIPKGSVGGYVDSSYHINNIVWIGQESIILNINDDGRGFIGVDTYIGDRVYVIGNVRIVYSRLYNDVVLYSPESSILISSSEIDNAKLINDSTEKSEDICIEHSTLTETNLMGRRINVKNTSLINSPMCGDGITLSSCNFRLCLLSSNIKLYMTNTTASRLCSFQSINKRVIVDSCSFEQQVKVTDFSVKNLKDITGTYTMNSNIQNMYKIVTYHCGVFPDDVIEKKRSYSIYLTDESIFKVSGRTTKIKSDGSSEIYGHGGVSIKLFKKIWENKDPKLMNDVIRQIEEFQPYAPIEKMISFDVFDEMTVKRLGHIVFDNLYYVNDVDEFIPVSDNAGSIWSLKPERLFMGYRKESDTVVYMYDFDYIVRGYILKNDTHKLSVNPDFNKILSVGDGGDKVINALERIL